MQLPATGTASKVCEFIQSYNSVWASYFPDCAQRGHWQIAQIVRTHEDGLLFSEIKSKLALIYGMDEDTCEKRTGELLKLTLLETDNSKLRSQTTIKASTHLIERFDSHAAEVAELLCAIAKNFDSKVPKLRQATRGQPINRRLTRFFDDFVATWNEYRVRFLMESASRPKLATKSLRHKANNDLKTSPYWHILTTAWMHRHNLEKERRAYLVVESFHSEIEKQFDTTTSTTAGYVQDMEDWGILDRLGKADGVLRNRYAVRMSNRAFATFTEALCQVAPLMVSAANDFARLSAGTGAKVLPFPAAS
jgi:hypothetical protein